MFRNRACVFADCPACLEAQLNINRKPIAIGGFEGWEALRAVHRARERADRAQGTTASYRPFTARRGALDAVFARHGSTAPISPRWRCAHVVDAEMMPWCSETVPRAGVRSDRPRKRVRDARGHRGVAWTLFPACTFSALSRACVSTRPKGIRVGSSHVGGPRWTQSTERTGLGTSAARWKAVWARVDPGVGASARVPRGYCLQ